MALIPIQFLPASRDRTRLLKVTQDTLNVDKSDFIERKAALPQGRDKTRSNSFVGY